MLALVATGSAKCALGTCPQAVPDPLATGVGAVGLLVVLRAFASGAAALTGVEAISNGVNAFRPPQGKNAAKTLVAMGAIAITLFIGVSYLAFAMEARPSGSVSLVSEIARATFPAGSLGSPMYYAVQALTFGILVLAANTSYQGFPRLAAVLARDRFFPRQFVNLGDRLVYSNGIVVLAAIAGLLIWTFNADVIALIHLYVIGVFTAFTLSQSGMVRYWLRRKEPGWKRRAIVNGAGAAATGLVALLVIQAKFAAGAWMVVVAIPALIGTFLLVNRHYRKASRRLRAGAAAVRAAAPAANEVVLYVEALDPATRLAAWYAREIAGRDYHPIWVSANGKPVPTLVGCGGTSAAAASASRRSRARNRRRHRPRLRLGASPRRLELRHAGDSGDLRTALPRVCGAARRTTFALKLRLLSEPGIAIADVPVVTADDASAASRQGRRPSPRLRCPGRLPARHQLHADARARRRERRLLRVRRGGGASHGARLEPRRARPSARGRGGVVPRPRRPLLRYLRGLTADPDVLVSVVMPELVFSGWRKLLHNQRALYIKRLLLFESRVVLSSVPYHLP